MSVLRTSSPLLLLVLLLRNALTYSEKCPAVCNCTVSSFYCASLNASTLHNSLLYLSAPDSITILNVTLRGGDVASVKYFPFMQNLEFLDISGTSLTRVDFPSEIRFPSLRTLLLNSNKIEELTEDSFAAFPNLEVLSLRDNNISTLSYEYLKLIKLRRLDMSHNSIKNLPTRVFRLLSNLEYLDISMNEMKRAMSSDFQSQQRLRHLNLSRNSLVQFDFDTFAKNVRVVNLLTLNISGNPIDKISSWDFEFDRLQIIVASDMPSLRVVDASAFSKAKDLRLIDLSINPNLSYISPSAFENCSSVHSLDVRGSGLEVLFASNLKDVAQVKIAESSLNCECMLAEVDNIASSTIDDWEDVTCTSSEGNNMKLSAAKSGVCEPRPILPFGSRLSAQLGSTYYLYCGARSEKDEVYWKLPNGTTMRGAEPMKPSGVSVMDYFSNSLYHPDSQFVPARPRIYPSKEWLRIDVVAEKDEGEYECIVKRGKQKVTRALSLSVERVAIEIETLSTGPHYISLSWNQTLAIQAVDRVALRLRIIDAKSNERLIQLSLHNPWTTYNVMRLRPNMNYTMCLEYSLAETLDKPLLSSCIHAATPQIHSLFSSVDTSVIVIFLGIIALFIGFNVLRFVWNYLHIWQQTKKRSRMAASLSGQSIVSHSSTINGVTYENEQLALRRVDSTSETSACLLPGGSSSSGTSDVPV
ncbi:iglr-1 [Pristionchus pacificus]|uniref:Iglr-1 n=1 Tax=Pristionchus pacificus TaxID=54126 RepID=A0A2A6CU76_PRIPA|nr:iglr-1 [Pristionchus pacificus]|eukprot:PDM81636.1 iglr-1 [Pristionchus pacificus]